MNNSVDIFGRTRKWRSFRPGPPGIGFSLTAEGDYDLKGKKLVNLTSGEEENDAISTGYVTKLLNDRIGHDATKNSVSVHGCRICDLATPIDGTDAVSLSFLNENALIRDQKYKVIDAQSCRIANLGAPAKETDAISAEILFSRGLVNSTQVVENGHLENTYNAENKRLRNVKSTLYEKDAVTTEMLFESLKLVQKLIFLELCDLGVTLRKEIHNLREKARTKEEVKKHLNSIEGSVDRNWRKALHVSQNKPFWTFSDVNKLPDITGLDVFLKDFAESTNTKRNPGPTQGKLSKAKVHSEGSE